MGGAFTGKNNPLQYIFEVFHGLILHTYRSEYVTWRLCFYINLAFGIVAAVAVLLFMPKQDKSQNPRWSLSLKEKVKNLDVIGLLVLLPTIICLLLALQWGNSKYHWSNARIIVLFILSGLLFGLFIATQLWQKDKATVPLSIVKRRTMWSCSIFSFFLFGSFLVIAFYLPIWFQAIKGNTATESGIHNLPSIVGTTLLSLVAGGLVFAFGYYTWACLVASVLSAVVSLLTPPAGSFSFEAVSDTYADVKDLTGCRFAIYLDSRVGLRILDWVPGYIWCRDWFCEFIHEDSSQDKFRPRSGLTAHQGLQQPIIAVQTALPDYQISEGTAIIIFVQNLSGAIFLSVAQNVFNNKLVANVIAQKIPVNPGSLLSTGATQVANLVDPKFLEQLKFAYNAAIDQTFYVGVAAAGLSIVGSAFIPWLSVKQEKKVTDASSENNKLECAS
ncbi:MAG: hypothetical protein M1822_003310 [Bathelium mastoideum]|nr:MAG: hypothetical protein M1822_003310 [Bathelium mastoideum]